MYLIYTDERTEKGPQLEVLFVVEERRKSRWFGEHLPKGRRHFKTTLNQVANAEHPDKTLDKENKK